MTKAILQIVINELTITNEEKMLSYMEYFVRIEDEIEEDKNGGEETPNESQRTMPSSSTNTPSSSLGQRIEIIESKQADLEIKIQQLKEDLMENIAENKKMFTMLLDKFTKVITPESKVNEIDQDFNTISSGQVRKLNFDTNIYS